MRLLRQGAGIGALVLVLVLSTTGQAQRSMNPLRQLTLSSEDFQMMGETVTHLYDAERIGVAETWSNPKSGNSGSVKIIETFELRGLPCRTVEYVVKIRRQEDTKRAVLRTCRETDGSWKIV